MPPLGYLALCSLHVMGSGTKPLSEYPVVKDILNILWIIKAALRVVFLFPWCFH